jgi:Flp pilus assembly pilin Flp
MQSIKNLFIRLVNEESGASASEYAVLTAFIVAGVAAAVALFDIQGIFTTLSDNITGFMNSAPTAP